MHKTVGFYTKIKFISEFYRYTPVHVESSIIVYTLIS